MKTKNQLTSRILSWVLCICMVLSMLPLQSLTVYASDGLILDPDGEDRFHPYLLDQSHIVDKKFNPIYFIYANEKLNGMTLDAAIDEVQDCGAADHAVVKLLTDADVGVYQIIDSGVFTLDLNGKTLEGTIFGLYITDGTVTISGGSCRRN